MELRNTYNRDRNRGFTRIVDFGDATKSRAKSTSPKFTTGFTLIEILVSVGILAVVIGLSMFASFDFYRGGSFRSEKEVIVSALQKARSQSMNNINEARHGVRFASPLQYIIFECDASTPQCDNFDDRNPDEDLIINPAYTISISTPSLPFDVIFEQLSGACVDSDSFVCGSGTPVITLIDGLKSTDIGLNKEGRINW